MYTVYNTCSICVPHSLKLHLCGILCSLAIIFTNHMSPWQQFIHTEAGVTDVALLPEPSQWPHRTSLSLCWVDMIRTGLYGANCWRPSLQPKPHFLYLEWLKGGNYSIKWYISLFCCSSCDCSSVILVIYWSKCNVVCNVELSKTISWDCRVIPPW